MKRIAFLLILTMLVTTPVVFGQTKTDTPVSKKRDQAEMYNNFYIAYGLGSIFYFIDNDGYSARSSSGNFLAGYSRSLHKIVAVGFQLSYCQIDRGDNGYHWVGGNYIRKNDNMYDKLWQGMANVRFQYLNRSSFCMYSGIGMGVTLDDYRKEYADGTSAEGQKLLPAGQLTFIGFRVGRAFSFFGEFGIGTQSILQAGFSYKFGDND